MVVILWHEPKRDNFRAKLWVRYGLYRGGGKCLFLDVFGVTLKLQLFPVCLAVRHHTEARETSLFLIAMLHHLFSLGIISQLDYAFECRFGLCLGGGAKRVPSRVLHTRLAGTRTDRQTNKVIRRSTVVWVAIFQALSLARKLNCVDYCFPASSLDNWRPVCLFNE